MLTEDQIIAQTKQAFSDAARPEHFTDYSHCEECQEHNDLLRSRDLDTLKIEDVGNPGWNPISFTTPEAFRYYLPALMRLSLAEPPYGFGWYLPLLLFKLTYDGAQSRHLQFCSRQQRRAVAAFLKYVAESRRERVIEEGCTDELLRAIGLWDVV